jgi:hypothetical protein
VPDLIQLISDIQKSGMVRGGTGSSEAGFVLLLFIALAITSLVAIYWLGLFVYQAFKKEPGFLKKGKTAFEISSGLFVVLFVLISALNYVVSDALKKNLGVFAPSSVSVISIEPLFYIMAAISLINAFLIFQKITIPASQGHQQPYKPSESISQIKCPNCGKTHDLEYPYCPYCYHENASLANSKPIINAANETAAASTTKQPEKDV